jgi:mannose-6-phosphate isomerase-like protein (cupin superfamily)
VTTRNPESPINLAEKCKLLDELWSPHIVAELNDYQFKVANVEGDFVWHDHPETDEAFLVLDGTLSIDLPDRTVILRPGDLFIVPKGVRHRPRAEHRVSMLLIEPRGVVNTGDERGELTAELDAWI